MEAPCKPGGTEYSNKEHAHASHAQEKAGGEWTGDDEIPGSLLRIVLLGCLKQEELEHLRLCVLPQAQHHYLTTAVRAFPPSICPCLKQSLTKRQDSTVACATLCSSRAAGLAGSFLTTTSQSLRAGRCEIGMAAVAPAKAVGGLNEAARRMEVLTSISHAGLSSLSLV